MNAQLQAIKDAVDAEVGDGSDFDGARRLSDQYVAEHPDEFTSEITEKTLPELVQAVDVLRSAGLEESQWRVEAWLLHHFEPQNIGGPSAPAIRILQTP